MDKLLAIEGKLLRILGLAWGISCIGMILIFAIVRLFSVTIDALNNFPFFWYHWVILILVIGLMAYSEGYKGFQKSFSPRVAARARYLYMHPQPIMLLLAPLFLVGYININPCRQRNIFLLTLGIFILIFMVSFLAQPWRGIVDAGVVIGLTWGLVSLVFYCCKVMGSQPFEYSAEVPQPKTKN
tara:strand:+ start:1823 stop:2374 length:552 start_codon:yes stop_codon:yes gene_type:complete